MGNVIIHINDIPYSIGVGSTVVYKVDGEPRKLSIFRDDGDRFVAVDVRTAKIKYIYKDLSSDIADLRLRIDDVTPAEICEPEGCVITPESLSKRHPAQL